MPAIGDFKARPKPTEPCRLSISASNCRVELSRIVLHRDVYYMTMDEMTPGRPPDARDEGHASGRPISLGDDEYFMLGDNSAQSKDARFFGPVKADAIIGTARWIYWPRSRWHEFR